MKLRGLLSLKLLKNSDGVGGLNPQVFSKSVFSENFLLIKFANAFAKSSSLNPCPFSLASVYVSGLNHWSAVHFCF